MVKENKVAIFVVVMILLGVSLLASAKGVSGRVYEPEIEAVPPSLDYNHRSFLGAIVTSTSIAIIINQLKEHNPDREVVVSGEGDVIISTYEEDGIVYLIRG